MHVATRSLSADVIDLRDELEVDTDFPTVCSTSTVTNRATPRDELPLMTEPTPAEQLEELVREHLMLEHARQGLLAERLPDEAP